MPARDGYHADEWEALDAAVRRNCTCEFDNSILTKRCEPHTMMTEDERALNGLLFLRRQHERACFSEKLTGKD